MTVRMTNPAQLLPGAWKGIGTLLASLDQGGLPGGLGELVGLRVSQLNGCSPCVYAHTQGARKAGESEDRLTTIAAWREAPFFTDAERAAFELAESATRLADQPEAAVPDELWHTVEQHFDEKQLAALVLTIGVVNLFNRINVTIREQAGATWG